jgi:hypothetical protein
MEPSADALDATPATTGARMSRPTEIRDGRWSLVLFGKVPSKKNSRGMGKGRVFVKDEDKAVIDSLIWQARTIWSGAPAIKPSIEACFVVRDGRSDMDNKWTTVQDCLVKAGVLKNDSIAQLCGPITLRARIEDVAEESVEIEVTCKTN